MVSKDPEFSVRSRSLSVFVQASANLQQTITLESSNLEIERGDLALNIDKIDVDVDLNDTSVRVNHAIVESSPFSLNLKGASNLPTKNSSLLDAISASYKVRIALKLLNQIPELDLPDFTGSVNSQGTVKYTSTGYEGQGEIGYQGVSIDEYQVGSGDLSYAIKNSQANLSEIKLKYAGGELQSETLHVDLKDRGAVSGALTMHGIRLEGILEAVREHDAPVRMNSNGNVKVSGYLMHPFALNLDVDAKFEALQVLKDNRLPFGPTNDVLSVKGGKVGGRLAFSPGKMDFQAAISLLEGTAKGEGYVAFAGGGAKVHVVGEGLSLTELGQISGLDVGGKTNLVADMDAKDNFKLTGNFDVTKGEVGNIVLGSVKGMATFQNDLLAFENLELPSLEPVRGRGFVDFAPKKTHYKFEAETRRVEINQVLAMFKNQKLNIE